MGSTIAKPTSVRFNITAKDINIPDPNDKIRKVQVIGAGGKVLASKRFSAHSVAWQPVVRVENDRYMFVRVFNGERSAHTAVAAPVWFE